MRAARAASADRERKMPPKASSASNGAAGSADVEDALAKRCKDALSKRLEVLQKCKDASTAYACLVDLQEALSVSRGEIQALRKNYDEVYEICEGWHEKCLALQSEKETRSEDAAEAKDHAAASAEL